MKVLHTKGPTGTRALRRNVLIGAILILVLGATALAQVITGDLLGTVTDPTGAVVPSAKVTAKNLATNATRTVQTGAGGEYVLNLLPPGHYSLSVESQGFKSFKISDVSLSAGDRARMDVQLQVGNTTENIEVTAAAPLLQTDSSSVGDTISEQTVQEIPLNGRNLTNLVTQQVGVNAGPPTSITAGGRPDDRRQSSEISANGQREYLNSNTLDGIDNNERYYGLGGIKPSIDAIQEIRVETNNFSAETGRAAGAAVTVITKSGGNQFHGTVYEYFRNDVLNAWDYFDKEARIQEIQQGLTPAKKSEWRQNQFGGSVSGPIIKDKTFFFYDIEEFRLVQGIASPKQYVPSAAGRAAMLGVPGVVSANTPIAQKIVELWPLPNAGLDPSNPNRGYYISNPSKTQYSTSMDARVDHRFSSKDSIFVRYSFNPVKSTFPPYFPECDGVKTCNGDASLKGVQPAGAGFISNGAFPGTNKTWAQGAQINYTRIFTDKLVLTARMGFMRINIDSEPIGKGTNGGTKLGIPNADGVTGDARATGTPGFHFLDGTADLGDQIAYPIQNIQNTFQWNGDVIYTRGNHNIKVGAALVRRQLNYLQDFTPQGWDFMLSPELMTFGVNPVFENRQNAYFMNYLRNWEPSFYAQDDWHARPWLTLNLGLRYDIYTPLSDAKGRYANFDFGKMALDIGGSAGVSTYYGNIAPRVGFAAQLGSGFVLRGGFGMVTYPGDYSAAIALFNPPYSAAIACSPIAFGCGGADSHGNAIGSLAAGPPNSPSYESPTAIYTAGSGLTVVSKQTNWHSGYLEQFNLIMQKQIGKNAFTLGYVGSLGRHQDRSEGTDQNMAQADSTGTIHLNSAGAAPWFYASQLPGVTYLQTFRTNLTSNYNAMQLAFDRKYAKGLTTNINWTWAHGLNDWSGYESGGSVAFWRNNPRYNYGNSDNDIRHRLAATMTYDLPFGNNLKGASSLALKGWSISASGFWQTGIPLMIADSSKPGGSFGDVNESINPNVIRGVKVTHSGASVNSFLNPLAFDRAGLCGETVAQTVANANAYNAANPNSPPVQPGSCLWTQNATNVFPIDHITLSNQRFNQYFGPHLRQLDMSLYKSFYFTEATRLQFRAECYNVTNTPNFAQPSNDINSMSYDANGNIASTGNFGKILSTAQGFVPRVWQFALKLTF